MAELVRIPGSGVVLEPGYADPGRTDEAQRLPITVLVDRLQYPTLGCPALLRAGQPLRAVVSLPEGQDPARARLGLVDRHRGAGEHALVAEPSRHGWGADGKHGRRQIWLLDVELGAVAPGLYDLALDSDAGREVQPNAVRIFAAITGDERVVFCSDLRFCREDEGRVRRFVDRMNGRDDIAWIALIGDVCHNGPRGADELLRLAGAGPGPVTSRYEYEYPAVARELARLDKPIVIVPGDRDGMAAYDDHAEGTPSAVEVGPDPANAVAYDGLHHFRRTFGPPFTAFDWHRTRYSCFNTYALARQHRLACHGVAANRGGWLAHPQVGPFSSVEVGDANARDMGVVFLMHHDPRGAVHKGRYGRYDALRPLTRASLADTALAQWTALAPGASARRQVFMRRPDQPLSEHPMHALLTHMTWARSCTVISGHCGEFSVEEYPHGEDIMSARRRPPAEPPRTFAVLELLRRRFAAPRDEVTPVRDGARDMSRRTSESSPPARSGPQHRATSEPPSPALVGALADRLAAGDLAGALAALDARPTERAREAVERAVARLAERAPPLERGASDASRWQFFSNGSRRFVHLDPLAADADDGGYVIADLHDGRPVSLQRIGLATGEVRSQLRFTTGG